MKTILQRQVELATAHGPRWVSDRSRLLWAAGLFALLVLGPEALGVCPCTSVAIGSLVMILAAALLVGNSAITALAQEREKKTLVFLRLTLLSAPQVLLLKLVPEFLVLRSLLLVTAPTVLVASLFEPGLFWPAFSCVVIAALTGCFAAASGVFLSTLFQNRSKAVVGGWIFKAAWLILTPLLDTVVAAVTVQTTTPPVFLNLNPLAAWWFNMVPEAAVGAQQFLPILVVPALLLVSIGLILVAARRFDMGHIVGNIVGDEQMHPVYQSGWGPAWLQQRLPTLKKNALFLRELASQLRGGAGRWPGYAVFAVLFLAPFVYARLWATQPSDESRTERTHLVVSEAPVPVDTHGTDCPAEPEVSQGQVGLTAPDGTEFVLIGHKPTLCFRLLLNQVCDVPLPPGEIHQVAAADWRRDTRDEVTRYNDQQNQALGSTNVAPRPADNDDDLDMAAINHSSVAWGLTGAVFMLLIYLGIRCSGFLAGAVTGERERRSWEDLALTSQDPSEAMAGKLLGTLLLPVVQMTAMFPLLGFFVCNGSLSVVEVGFLYAYAVALAVGAGLLGLWSSTVSGASHEAHARALLLGVVSYLIVPAFLPLAALFSIAALARSFYGVTRRDATSLNLAWAGLGVSLMLLPAAASPLTAVLTFMPSLAAAAAAAGHFFHPVAGAASPFFGFFASMLSLGSLCFLMWHGVLTRLQEPGQEHGMRTEFSNAA